MKYRLSVLTAALTIANMTHAATSIHLQHQPASYINNLLATQSDNSKMKIVVTRKSIDFNGVTHTRIQQTYENIPVWDAVGILHTPSASSLRKENNHASMNGMIYEALEKDLSSAPAFTKEAGKKALAIAKNTFAKSAGLAVNNIKDENLTPIIFIDENKIAHRAYLTSFILATATDIQKPTSIIDATTNKVYKTWEGILFENAKKTAAIKAAQAKIKAIHGSEAQSPHVYDVQAGGIGGNAKIGEIAYDGLVGNPAPIDMTAIEYTKEIIPGTFVLLTQCVLMNNDTSVEDASLGGDGATISTPCSPDIASHNHLTWLSLDKSLTRWNNDEMNEGYSPALDAFYAATMVKNMYQDWFNIPALVDSDGQPMAYILRVHYGRQFDNAFWNGREMTFGDGGRLFYPLTSPGVTAHEISHGFTQTHSNIDYSKPEMAALHESFSDMAAVSIENYLTGKNSWEVGGEIKKDDGALRYLDNPRKDGRSIDNMKDFDQTEPHRGAGITNKAFYLLATTAGWSTRKAFSVMVKANMDYWDASITTLGEAACGIVQATKDYAYDAGDVRVALSKVGIDTDECDETAPT